jgi:transposase
MTQVDDLSRSLVSFDQETSLIVVVEMSQSSWLAAGMIPGVDRQPLKSMRGKTPGSTADQAGRILALT